jgi:Fe-S oxidoreductase
MRGRAPVMPSRLMKFLLRKVLIGAMRAEILSTPLRLVRALRLDLLGGLVPGWLPVMGEKIRDLVAFLPHIGKPIRGELAPVMPAQGEKLHRVAFFLGCMMNAVMPDISRAAARVLACAGCEVVTPRGHLCCGVPRDDQAMLDSSREMARRNIALFETVPDDVEAIVTVWIRPQFIFRLSGVC